MFNNLFRYCPINVIHKIDGNLYSNIKFDIFMSHVWRQRTTNQIDWADILYQRAMFCTSLLIFLFWNIFVDLHKEVLFNSLMFPTTFTWHES